MLFSTSEDDNTEQQFLTLRNNKRVEFWTHKTRRDVHKHMHQKEENKTNFQLIIVISKNEALVIIAHWPNINSKRYIWKGR